MLTQHNCHISYHRNIPAHAAHNVVFAIEKILAAGIELRVVGKIVIALLVKKKTHQPEWQGNVIVILRTLVKSMWEPCVVSLEVHVSLDSSNSSRELLKGFKRTQ